MFNNAKRISSNHSELHLWRVQIIKLRDIRANISPQNLNIWINILTLKSRQPLRYIQGSTIITLLPLLQPRQWRLTLLISMKNAQIYKFSKLHNQRKIPNFQTGRLAQIIWWKESWEPEATEVYAGLFSTPLDAR